MNEHFIECRAMTHSWHHEKRPANGKYKAPFGGGTSMVGRISFCKNCGMERVRWITRSGEVINRYDPPVGYRTSGDDRMTPTEWRQLYVRDMFKD